MVLHGSTTDGGSVPFLPLALADMPADLRQRLEPRVSRLGYLGGFFGHAARQPRALAAFIDFGDCLRTALPDRLAEIVALTVATSLDNTYERNQHERLALTMGLDRQWLLQVTALDPRAASLLSETERAVQALVLRLLTSQGHNVGNDVAGVTEAVGPEDTVAILLLTGRYVAHSLFCNALSLTPPVSSVTPNRVR